MIFGPKVCLWTVFFVGALVVGAAAQGATKGKNSTKPRSADQGKTAGRIRARFKPAARELESVASKWTLIPELSDEFNGKSLDERKWYPRNPDWLGRKPGYFSTKNVAVKDGKLQLTMRMENLPNLPEGYHTFTSAAVKSKVKVRYGYFEIRAKAMDSRGSSAFWFYDNTPRIWTEIDVFEIGGKAPGREKDVYMTVHVFHTPTEKKHWSSGAVWKAPFRLADDYHTYALLWTKDVIKWYVDGEVRRTLKNTHWHQPLAMNFDSETMPNWFGLPKPENLPSTFFIDYVRSWNCGESTILRENKGAVESKLAP